jgi:hypothetical protein
MKGQIFIAIFCILPLLVSPQEYSGSEGYFPPNVPRVLYEQAHWMDGACLTFSLKDTLCLMGTGCAVDIMDISEPDAPEVISRFSLPWPVIDIVIDSTMAYYICGEGVIGAVDISNLYEPVVLDSTVTKALASELVVSDRYVFVASWATSVVFDFTTPEEPVFAANLPGSYLTYGLYKSGEYLYGATGLTGLTIWDISTPSYPVKISGLDFEGYSVDVCVDNRYAYCANEEWGVRVIDVSDPTTPVESALIKGMHSEHVFACNQILQVIVDAPAFYHLVVDVTDFENPIICSATYIATDAPNIFSDNKMTYLAQTKAFRIIDVSDPYNVFDLAYIDTPEHTIDIKVDGSVAYAVQNYGSVWSLDISNIQQIHKMDAIDIDRIAYCVEFKDSLLFVSGSSGLHILKVSDSATFTKLGEYETEYYPRDIVVRNNIAYLAGAYNGIECVDFSDPYNPSIAHVYSTSGSTNGLDIDGDLLFSSEHDRFRIYEIEPSGSLSTISSTPLPNISTYHDLDANNGYVYLSRSQHGVKIYDVSDPENPYLVHTISSPHWNSHEVYIYNDTLYNPVFKQGMYVYDITNPRMPEEIAWVPSVDQSENVFKSNGLIYMADYASGFFVYSFNAVFVSVNESPVIDVRSYLEIFPNPVTEATQIGFYIDQPGNVEIRITDASGHLIGTSIKKFYKSGSHSYALNELIVDHLAPGIYICSLYVGNKMKTSRNFVIQSRIF